MSYPTIYGISYSYTGFQASLGDGSFPGTQLDADMAGLSDSIASINAFIQVAFRSDGVLKAASLPGTDPILQYVDEAATAAAAEATEIASAAATSASASATAAAGSATNAATSETQAASSASAAQTARTGAETAQTAAAASAAAAAVFDPSSYLSKSGNLAGLADKAAARANLALATVAASGAYGDLSGKPTLGSAASRDVGTAAGNLVALDGAGKLPAVDGSQLTNLPAPLVRGATIATTSGTAIDFVGIPSTARKITLGLKGVTTSAASAQIVVQIGSGAVVTTGYVGSMMHGGGSNSTGGIGTVTNGIAVAWDDPASAMTGICTLINRTGNEWVLSSTVAETGKAYVAVAGGIKELAGVLDRVRITTTGGSNTFAGGSITIFWE